MVLLKGLTSGFFRKLLQTSHVRVKQSYAVWRGKKLSQDFHNFYNLLRPQRAFLRTILYAFRFSFVWMPHFTRCPNDTSRRQPPACESGVWFRLCGVIQCSPVWVITSSGATVMKKSIHLNTDLKFEGLHWFLTGSCSCFVGAFMDLNCLSEAPLLRVSFFLTDVTPWELCATMGLIPEATGFFRFSSSKGDGLP